jgi:hypothetical protein
MNKLGRKLVMFGLAAAMSGTALLATPKDAAAQNPWWFYVDGGYSFLLGDFNDLYDGGFTTNVAFGQILAQRFALGLFGGVGFHSAKTLIVNNAQLGNATAWRYGVWGGVNAMQPEDVWAVWFGLGVGGGTLSFGDREDSQGATLPGTGTTETKFMLQGNLAIQRQVSEQVSIGIDGTYYIVFTENTNWTAIPLTLSVSIVP